MSKEEIIVRREHFQSYCSIVMKGLNSVMGIIIILSLLLSMTACITKTTQSAEVLSPADFSVAPPASSPAYYSATSLDLTLDVGEGYSVAKDMTIAGDFLAVLMRFVPQEDSDPARDYVVLYDASGEQTGAFEVGDKMPMAIASKIITDTDGNILVMDIGSSGATMCRFNQAGGYIGSPLTLTLPNGYASWGDLHIDKTGNFYLPASGPEGLAFAVFDENGVLKNTFIDDGLWGGWFEFGDTSFVDGVADNSRKPVIYPVDLSEGELGKAIDVSEILQGSIMFSGNGYAYSVDQIGISLFDMTSKEKRILVSWNDSNMDLTIINSIRECQMLSEETVFLMAEPEANNMMIEMLTRQQENPNEGKKSLIVAGFFLEGNEQLLSSVTLFNETNLNYTLQIKDYGEGITYRMTEEEYNTAIDAAWEQFSLDVANGQGPDIFFGNSDSLLEAGNLVDLMPLIEADSSFEIANYIPNIIEAYKIDGKLYTMPIEFVISSLMGESSVIGEQSGWTVDEFVEMADSLPVGTVALGDRSQSNLLYFALSNSYNDYVNHSSKQVCFDSDNFMKLLNWAKTYGLDDEKYENGEVFVDEYTLLQNRQLALTSAGISHPNNISQIWNYFPVGEPLNFVGYPSPSRPGPSVDLLTRYSILSNSKYAEGAWEFIRICISEEAQNEIVENEQGIPILKSSVDYLLDRALYPEKYDWVDDMTGEGYMPDAVSEEDAGIFIDLMYSANSQTYMDSNLWAIIQEEVQAFFNDQKTVEDVAVIIQNRAQTYMDEKS